jgi:hypothetical protein
MTLQQQSINAAIVVALNYWCGNIIAENTIARGYLSKFTSIDSLRSGNFKVDLHSIRTIFTSIYLMTNEQ